MINTQTKHCYLFHKKRMDGEQELIILTEQMVMTEKTNGVDPCPKWKKNSQPAKVDITDVSFPKYLSKRTNKIKSP